MEEKEINVEDRRKYVRLNADVQVDYDIMDAGKEQQSATRNISAGGICLIVNEKLDVGTTLQLSIHLPDKQAAIITKGKVKWVKPFTVATEKERYDAGVEFVEINEEQRQIINRYVLSIH